MRRGLIELFLSLDRNYVSNSACGDLFGEVQAAEQHFTKADTEIICGLYSEHIVNPACLCEPARMLFNSSQDAFSGFVHAWMSELPIEAEIIRFGRKIIKAGECRGHAANRAAIDRGDPDTAIVLEAACKVEREIDRLRGLLRFSPNSEGIYTALCSPDHFVLPALKEHFSRRFGSTPWAIIDEKRGICTGGEPRPSDPTAGAGSPQGGDEWEELWRNYHKTINNESRNNPELQRRFMPRRYRKYLTEL